MRKIESLEHGHCEIKDFVYWMNERHRIYINRFEKKLSKPWTQDLIFQRYRFTNIFRQLDKGTITLTKMLNGQTNSDLILFNIFWYRNFNRFEHGDFLGFIDNYEVLDKYINNLFNTRQPIFTGAHIVPFSQYEFGHISYLKLIKTFWDNHKKFTKEILKSITIQKAHAQFMQLPFVGRFKAYEFACDCRFTQILKNANDKITWASMGPGSQRGLYRLGLPYKNQQQGCKSMCLLYKECISLLDDTILNASVPFELREIEHSLCEFDKYQRALRKEGPLRRKFNGS